MNSIIPISFKTRKLEALTFILVFLFPILMAIVSDAVSSIWTLLIICGAVVYFKKLTPKLNRNEKIIMWGFVLVFVVYFLGMLNSQNIYDGFKKLGKFDNFLLAAPALLLLKLNKTITLKAMYLGLICTGPALLIYFIASYSGGNIGYFGSYHSIIFGSFSMLVAGLALLLFMLVKASKIYKTLFLISSACAIMASFFVGSRGPWLAILAIVAILIWLAFNQRQLRIKILSGFAICSLAISLAFISLPNLTKGGFMQAVNNISGFLDNPEKYQHTSAGVRFILWKSSIYSFVNHPWFGSGSGDFRPELKKFIKENPKHNIGVFSASHNVFLEWLGLMGGVGFLVLLLTVFLLPLRFFIQIIKTNPEQLWLGVAGIWVVVSHMIFGLTESWIIRSAPVGVYVFFIILLMALVENKKQ